MSTILLSLFGIIVLIYALAWALSFRKFPVEYGISFSQTHATSLGLNWKLVYEDMLRELDPQHVRIAAMWNQVEPEEGKFSFDDVDWMMEKAEEYGTKVVLVVGQKAPRWPECHIPRWIEEKQNGRDEYLFRYVEETVTRYQHHPALDVWQVENEPFISFAFGECAAYNQQAVREEIALVKRLDPEHNIIVTDSGELSTWLLTAQAGDVFGTTMYRIVKTPGGATVAYDWLPAGFYRMKARALGRGLSEFFVSELQAEPWFTDGTPLDTSLEDQYKTMSPDRLVKHLQYAERVGASRVYLWGVEWWYWMKKEHGNVQYWDIVKDAIKKTR